MGQLKTKNLHSTDSTTFKQAVAYAYNERGWLQSSSAPLFAMQLKYTDGTVPQYNGNIANQLWGVPGTLDKTYTYKYDNINRLLSGASSTNDRERSIVYDQRGNITNLTRFSNNAIIDSLTYNYTIGSLATNQLQSVNDLTASDLGQKHGSFTYTYDGNGNMVTDNSKGITIAYNLLNLPQGIAAKSTTYTYDAGGNKLRRVVGTVAIEYIDGIQYEGTAISFIQTEEGRALPNGATAYNYEYTLNDHLGNSRVGFDLSNNAARLVQTSNYYPFGLEAFNNTASNPKNYYLYNKKELQKNIGLYDYGARLYDPVIARWTSVDPLAEKSRRWSPYTYGENNSIRNIDPDGMATQGCCGFMGPLAGVSAYLAYVDIKQKVESVFGLKTYAQGGVDKVNNTIHKHDPGYNDNVPEKARAIHDKIMDNKADTKALVGALEWGSANMTAITGVMGMLQGPVGNSLETLQGPIDGYAGYAFKTEIQTVETKSPFDLEPTHGLTLSKRNFNLLQEDIKTNGIQEPIKYVENNGTNSVVDGHHRLMAAKKLGLEQVPVKKVQLPYSGYKTKDDLIYSRY